MESGKINYFERTDSEHHRDFIELHSHCALCGTVLELQHVVDHQTCEIKEEARCPECEVRTRAKIHTLN
ncbi:MAG: hypothetical protein KF802_11880 [Bdellovibrionaceae bacterium]|nr:hypothetical protein [Pseudobdellovibrionaceae bacterium]MBX3032813.1 hypothetical protein [Pseudobdellovibrionaceae bacterium]